MAGKHNQFEIERKMTGKGVAGILKDRMSSEKLSAASFSVATRPNGLEIYLVWKDATLCIVLEAEKSAEVTVLDLIEEMPEILIAESNERSLEINKSWLIKNWSIIYLHDKPYYSK
jgi:hypothetical protein